MAAKIHDPATEISGDNQRKFWASLRMLPGFDLHWQTFMGHFKDARSFWNAEKSEFRIFRSISPSLIENLLSKRAEIDPDAVLSSLYEQEIGLVSVADSDYPRQLHNIYNPPPVLYMKGRTLPDVKRAVAIVGTRKASIYAKEVAKQFAGELSKHGVTVVSGAAHGVDRAVHVEALAHEGGTIAVLGNGLDVEYPLANRDILRKIAEHGTVISEHPPGTPPLKRNFPARNRIISGLCAGTVVIEAPLKSGALITANFALDQGREVMVVPGNVLSGSNKGGHKLIRSGATLVEDVSDVFEALSWQFEKDDASLPGVSLMEWKILEELGWDATQIDDLIDRLRIDAPTIAGLLTMLELKGYIRQEVGKRFLRVH